MKVPPKAIQHETIFAESPRQIMDCQISVVASNEAGALIQVRMGSDPKSPVIVEYSVDRADALRMGDALTNGTEDA